MISIKFFLILCLIQVLMLLNLNAENVVIKKKGNKFFLKINNKPFFIKGVGCGQVFGKDHINYFPLAKEIGANTLRTWGMEQGNDDFFKEAYRYSFMVCAGMWLPHCNYMGKEKVFSYINDTEKLNQIEKDILSYVEKFKNHPSLLLWNVGNEVLMFTKEEKEKIAFCKFLEKLIQKIKIIDPLHPVTYACAGLAPIDYIVKYVPSIDVIGVNTYGSVDFVNSVLAEKYPSKPFMLTEFGPKGSWECPKDRFGKSIEEADYEKSFYYQCYAEDILSNKTNCLGGFAFYLGDTSQDSLTWWNLTIGKFKRESFYVLKKCYTGLTSGNLPPLCTKIDMEKFTFKPLEPINVKISARDRENDNLKYDIKVSTAKEMIMIPYPNEIIPVEIIKTGEVSTFIAPEKPAVYKLNAMVYDSNNNVSTRTITFEVC